MPTFDFAAISQAFSMEGEYRGAHPHGNGHIHDTFLFTCEGGARRYLVQRINERVFRDPERVMQNISIVTRHLHATLAARGVADCARRVLTPVQSREDRLLHRDASGCWRAFDFIEGAHGFDRATGESMAYEAARASASSRATSPICRPRASPRPSRPFTTHLPVTSNSNVRSGPTRTGEPGRPGRRSPLPARGVRSLKYRRGWCGKGRSRGA